MKKALRLLSLLVVLGIGLVDTTVTGQNRTPGEQIDSAATAKVAPNQKPSPLMSFFVTSRPKGQGANLGGLAGADALCQTLADEAGVGAGRVWRAYLSTQGRGAVNARDRIGDGPWYNARGMMIAHDVAELHGDTVADARVGNSLTKQMVLTEKGMLVNGVGDSPLQHDILTGSQPDGRAYADSVDHTCNNWTSDDRGSAQLGHADKAGAGNASWNSAHPSRGCSQAQLAATGGAGLLFCFEARARCPPHCKQ